MFVLVLLETRLELIEWCTKSTPLCRDPAAKQLLIHLNKKRAEAGHEQFIVADRES